MDATSSVSPPSRFAVSCRENHGSGRALERRPLGDGTQRCLVRWGGIKRFDGFPEPAHGLRVREEELVDEDRLEHLELVELRSAAFG
jgi:hypothetical protein